MARFSKKELELIKCFYLGEKKALKGGFKVKKAQLYRDVYQNQQLHSASANSACNQILKRFQELPKNEQDSYLKEWELNERKEEIAREAENLNLMNAKVQGREEAQKEFKLGYKDGQKLGAKSILEKLNGLDLETREGRIQARSYVFTQMNYIIDSSTDEENPAPVKVAAIKAMVDLTKEPFKEDEMKKLEALLKDDDEDDD